MSGRLVILPHKSWNVWNQDNREKVARDERLNREELEGKERKEKECVQERNLEQLLGFKRDSCEIEDVNAVGATNNDEQDQPFRLFGDLEEQERKNQELLAAKRLQEEKELLAKRRAGIAPWALGDGLAEMAGTNQQPWYLKKQSQPSNGHNTISSSSSAGPSGNGITTVNEIVAKERDELLKVKLDPMRTLLKSKVTTEGSCSSSSSSIGRTSRDMDSNRVLALLGGATANEYSSSSSSSSRDDSNLPTAVRGSQQDMTNSNNVNSSSSSSSSSTSSSGMPQSQKHGHDIAVLDDRSDKHHHRHKKHKKDKDKGKEKDKEKDKKKKRKADKDHGESDPSSGSSIAKHVKTEGTAKQVKTEEHDDVISALRRKRLDREQVERRRASLLLAQVEMYGTVGLEEKNVRYHSQYNPTLARPPHR